MEETVSFTVYPNPAEKMTIKVDLTIPYLAGIRTRAMSSLDGKSEANNRRLRIK
jgi:hypothetical protein